MWRINKTNEIHTKLTAWECAIPFVCLLLLVPSFAELT